MELQQRSRGPSGFSLIELMVAMGIFSVIGIAIVSLLTRATEFSRAGTSTTEVLDTLQSFTETFGADAGAIYSRSDSDDGAPVVRLYSDVVKTDVDGDQRPDAQVRRLMFVRMIPGEATGSVTRTAGSNVGATAVMDQNLDLEKAAKGSLRPTGGLMEVFWTAVPENKDDLALLTAYRGVLAPPGVAGKTFFPTKWAADPTARGPVDRGPVDLKDVQAVARPVLAGILYFGVDFWSRRTETWDATIVPPKGPLQVWDSTRGIIPKGKGIDGFWFAKPNVVNETPTLLDSGDDTFPRRMRVTLVAEEAGQTARTGLLMSELSADAAVIDVSDVRFIPATDTTQRFVKIGPEWIEFGGVEGNRITGCKRGVRGTTAVAHEYGSRVHYGRTVVREIAIATYRDAYRDELPSISGRK
ncbi:MAG: prepilin-type N-terminal cleavage/methylation domain-containing protein [Planctomycetes bacterium]|nr:prepilin-type N-terminal cleavage/methylation domain-containing protein [Planctomycetota bacterium]